MQYRFILLTVLVIISLCAATQPIPYPKNYFRSPVDIPLDLSANFGELRSNHWHMGLDIRTKQKENLPVYAAAGGYIASIGIRPQSFGRFIIINHPNGLSTLYAHLNDFFPALESYVTEKQYANESWAIELKFAPDEFPVNARQFIAHSGNTGGSQGPHLHFEIFDTRSGKRLNPLLFGFPISDKVAPTIVKLAMYDRTRSVYEQSPVFYSLKKTDSGYIIPGNKLIRTGLEKVSFAIQAYDRQSGSNNPNGIYSAKIYQDEEPLLAFILDSIDYDETVYMNAHIDYMHKANGGVYVQHLSRLPGDHGAAYKSYVNDGIVQFSDTLIHRIDIDVKDPYGNTSTVNFKIQWIDSLSSPGNLVAATAKVKAGETYAFEKHDFEIKIPSQALYDNIQPLYYRNSSGLANAISAVHKFSDATIPVHTDISVRIKPDRLVPAGWKDKLLIQRSGKGNTIRKATWEGEWLSASFGDLGSFQVLADVIPPFINELGKGDTINLSAASRIMFSPTDNFGIVKKFRAELNGKWLRFTNDKSRNWIYQFDERCPYGVHFLTVTVEDHVGNQTTKSWWFKREPYTPPVKKKALKKKSAKKKGKK